MKKYALLTLLASCAMALGFTACTVTVTDDADSSSAGGSGGSAGKPDATTADVTQSDAATADVTQSDTTTADVDKSDTATADVAQSDATTTDVTQSDATTADVDKSDSAPKPMQTCQELFNPVINDPTIEEEDKACAKCLVANCCNEVNVCLTEPQGQQQTSCGKKLECLYNTCIDPNKYDECRVDCDKGDFNTKYNEFEACFSNKCASECRGNGAG